MGELLLVKQDHDYCIIRQKAGLCSLVWIPFMLSEFFHFDFALGLMILNGRGRVIDRDAGW